MKKAAVVIATVLILLSLIGLGADRAVASVAERTISEQVQKSVTGATSVSTSIAGIPVLTQVAHGSLDHVTVTMDGVPAGRGITLGTLVVDLYGVATASPRTADRVRAVASVSTATLQAQLGDSWTVRPDGDTLAVTWRGPLPVEARVTPVVREGHLALDLASITILGVSVDGSSVPAAVTDQLTALAGSIGALPLGLTVASVAVTRAGVDLVATGTHVVLEAV